MAEGGQVTPRTAAGRRFVAAVAALFIDPDDDSAIDVTDEILAIEREAQGIPLIDVELLARALASLAYGPDDDSRLDSGEYGLLERPSEFAERIAAEYARLATSPIEEGPS